MTTMFFFDEMLLDVYCLIIHKQNAVQNAVQNDEMGFFNRGCTALRGIETPC
jgi:hypothetical protein